MFFRLPFLIVFLLPVLLQASRVTQLSDQNGLSRYEVEDIKGHGLELLVELPISTGCGFREVYQVAELPTKVKIVTLRLLPKDENCLVPTSLTRLENEAKLIIEPNENGRTFGYIFLPKGSVMRVLEN